MTQLDRWLICGNWIDPDKKDLGCTCRAHDPTAFRAEAAIARRKREKEQRDASE